MIFARADFVNVLRASHRAGPVVGSSDWLGLWWSIATTPLTNRGCPVAVLFFPHVLRRCHGKAGLTPGVSCCRNRERSGRCRQSAALRCWAAVRGLCCAWHLLLHTRSILILYFFSRKSKNSIMLASTASRIAMYPSLVSDRSSSKW